VRSPDLTSITLSTSHTARLAATMRCFESTCTEYSSIGQQTARYLFLVSTLVHVEEISHVSRSCRVSICTSQEVWLGIVSRCKDGSVSAVALGGMSSRLSDDDDEYLPRRIVYLTTQLTCRSRGPISGRSRPAVRSMWEPARRCRALPHCARARPIGNEVRAQDL
jgi:hypothetical protein